MASGMVQEMLSLNNVNYRTSRHKSADSDHDRESMPSTPGSSQHDSVFSLEEDLEDTLSSSLQVSSGSRGSPNHSCTSHHQNSQKTAHLSSSLSMWRLPEELYNCEEEFLLLDSGRESDHESHSDTESTISSISTRSYSKESTSSSNGGGLSGEEGTTTNSTRQKVERVSPELGGKSSDMFRLDPGYCTLPHPPKNGAKAALIKRRKMPAAFKRISTIGIARKRKSVTADISSPSPVHKSSLSPTHTPTQVKGHNKL